MLTPERIQRHCLEHLEAYMVPKVVDIRNTLPTTTSGKVSRRTLEGFTWPSPTPPSCLGGSS